MLSEDEAHAGNNSAASGDYRLEDLEYFQAFSLRSNNDLEQNGIWREMIEPIVFNPFEEIVSAQLYNYAPYSFDPSNSSLHPSLQGGSSLQQTGESYQEGGPIQDQLSPAHTRWHERQIFSSSCKKSEKKTKKKQLFTKKNEESSLECSICFQRLKKSCKMPVISCGHIFHLRCLKKWSTKKDSCPMCRGPILQCVE